MSEEMTKLEKVIKGLEHCTREVTDAFVNECSMCPYKPTNDDEKNCVGRTQKDALELLKEQEQKNGMTPFDVLDAISCAYDGKQIFFQQENGMIYDRYEAEYVTLEEAVYRMARRVSCDEA